MKNGFIKENLISNSQIVLGLQKLKLDGFRQGRFELILFFKSTGVVPISYLVGGKNLDHNNCIVK